MTTDLMFTDNMTRWRPEDFGPDLQRLGWQPGLIPHEVSGLIPIGVRVRLKDGADAEWNGAATMLDYGNAIIDGSECSTMGAPASRWIVLDDQTPNPKHGIAVARALHLIEPEGHSPDEPPSPTREAWIAAIVAVALARRRNDQ